MKHFVIPAFIFSIAIFGRHDIEHIDETVRVLPAQFNALETNRHQRNMRHQLMHWF